ncbi:MAG: hypothetical protein GF390_02370 [Candidatus Pacebacteria bacterium]|nr:hypothetical protein [Candidatus Paceibacterota bacterium]
MINAKHLNWRLILTTRRYLILAVGFAITAVLILVLAIYPQTQSVLDLNSKLSKDKKYLQKLERKALELEQLKVSPEFSQADKVDETLPTHKPLLEMLNALNTIAVQTEVAITEFELNPGEIASPGSELAGSQSKTKSHSKTKYDNLEMEMKVAGQLTNVEEFLSLLERVTPLTTIIDLSLNRKKNAQDQYTGYVEAELTVQSYFYAPTIKTTIDSPVPVIDDQEKEIFQQILDYRPNTLETQTEIKGGGSEDLFGIQGLQQLKQDLGI